MIPKSFQIGAGGLSKAMPKISTKISSKTTPQNLILEPKWSQKASPKWRSAHTLFEAFFGAAVWMAFLPHFDGFWPPGGLPFGAYFDGFCKFCLEKGAQIEASKIMHFGV